MTEFEHLMLFMVGLATMVNSLSILAIVFFWGRK